MSNPMFRACVAACVALATTVALAQTPLKIAPKPAPKTEGEKVLDAIRRARPLLARDPVVATTVQPEDTIFPSLTISSATIKHDEASRSEFELGDLGGLMGIGVVAPVNNTPITVTVSCSDLMEPSTFKGNLKTGGATYAIAPKIKWKYRELLKSRQQMPVDVVFKVKIGTMEEKEYVRTCTLRTTNDCPLAFMSGEQFNDTHWVFAAYVNEDHPWVDGILRDALATGVVRNFTGYQTKDPDVVLRQVYAIWRVLQTRGLSYSDISRVSAAQGDTILSQHVRFLDECIVNKQANCIDGTVMLASILRKIGINPRIVFVPGHAFLAIDLDPQANDVVGLETTILGAARKEDFDRTKKLRSLLLDAKSFEETSWDTFQSALKVGTDRLIKELPKLTSNVDTTPEYWLISIAEAREIGVRPLPFVAPPAAGPEVKTQPEPPAQPNVNDPDKPRTLRRVR